MDRREFLKGLGLVAGGAALTACSPRIEFGEGVARAAEPRRINLAGKTKEYVAGIDEALESYAASRIKFEPQNNEEMGGLWSSEEVQRLIDTGKVISYVFYKGYRDQGMLVDQVPVYPMTERVLERIEERTPEYVSCRAAGMCAIFPGKHEEVYDLPYGVYIPCPFEGTPMQAGNLAHEVWHLVYLDGGHTGEKFSPQAASVAVTKYLETGEMEVLSVIDVAGTRISGIDRSKLMGPPKVKTGK